MKIKTDIRGISPIIATILLIAVTVAAGAVIAVYVSGLYVSGGTPVAGDISGNIYDSLTGATENYINENVMITFKTTTGYLRDVGDVTEGLQVVVALPPRGWGPLIANGRNQIGQYANGYVDVWGQWSNVFGVNTDNIVYRIYVPVRSDGRQSEGVIGYLYMYTYGKGGQVLNAGGTSGTATQSATKSLTRIIWNNDEYVTISVSSRGDSYTTSFGTVSLYGQSLD